MNLALVLNRQGDLGEERKLLQEYLDVERDLHPLDFYTASAMAQLGTVLSSMDELEEAQKMLEQAVQLQLQILDADDPVIAPSMGNLGLVFYRQGRLIEARRYFVDVVRILGN